MCARLLPHPQTHDWTESCLFPPPSTYLGIVSAHLPEEIFCGIEAGLASLMSDIGTKKSRQQRDLTTLRVNDFHAQDMMPICPSPAPNKLVCFLFCSMITRKILPINSLILELNKGLKFYKITSWHLRCDVPIGLLTYSQTHFIWISLGTTNSLSKHAISEQLFLVMYTGRGGNSWKWAIIW